MSESFKVSGKKSEFPQRPSQWKFTHRPGGWIIAERALPDQPPQRLRFLMSQSRGRLSAQIAGDAWHGEIISAGIGSSAGGGADSDLVAQFPGKVRKLLVKAGDSVQEGDPLLMVEAMKMEFPVKAPFSGMVKKVLVKEGQQLSPGDRFLDLEESGGQ